MFESLKVIFPFSATASKGGVVQTTPKKEAEVVAPKKKGTVTAQKNVKTSAKVSQEGSVSTEEDIPVLPIIDESLLQQVKDMNGYLETYLLS